MSIFNLQEALYSKYEERKHPRGLGGKWAKKYQSDVAPAKVIGKNILGDAIATGAAGASAGWARHSTFKLGTKAGLLGAGLGALWGAGEGVVKYNLLKNKNKQQLEKTVSSPAYKYSNVAGLALNSGLTQALVNKLEDPSHYKKLVRAAAIKSVKEPGIKNVVGRIAKKLVHSKVGRAALIGGTVAAAIGGDVMSDSASEAAQSKIYGPDRPSVTGEESLYTKTALKKGMFSGKKYLYGGLGPEIKKRKTNKNK